MKKRTLGGALMLAAATSTLAVATQPSTASSSCDFANTAVATYNNVNGGGTQGSLGYTGATQWRNLSATYNNQITGLDSRTAGWNAYFHDGADGSGAYRQYSCGRQDLNLTQVNWDNGQNMDNSISSWRVY